MEKVSYFGKNRYDEFLEAARSIAGKISEIKGVVGILATGGLGRGHCDDFSDLDLVIYAEDDVVKDLEEYLAVGWLRHKGIGLDTPVESHQEALKHESPSGFWSQVMRWDRENSQILYDTGHRISDLLRHKLVFPQWEQAKLMEEHRGGLTEHLIYNLELWEHRGRPLNLSHTLRQAAQHLILWIYAKNRKFQPYVPKWLFYHLENGFVPEASHFGAIQQIFCSPVGAIGDARRLKRLMLQICDQIGLVPEFRSLADALEAHEGDWDRAPQKTRHYLRW